LVLVTDPRQSDNPVIFANDAFINLTGYDREEVLGRNCRFLQGKDTDRQTIQQIRTAIASRSNIYVQVLNYKKDGTPFWNALYLGPVISSSGELEYFFSSQIDVTEWKTSQPLSQKRLAASQNDLSASNTALMDARTASELREQFIAVMGHDLRNPLAAISGGIRLLLRRPQDKDSQTILSRMESSVKRMANLVDNMMDFARGRLGGGIALDTESKSLETTFGGVIDEIRSSFPNRKILTAFDLTRPFEGDHARLAQLFSNLLGNAVTHGTETAPIKVTAVHSDEGLELVVSNAGNAIPAAAMEQLFKPFNRGQVKPSLQGLGLGLFIASEIAKAHGGELDVISDDTETRFRLRIPSKT
jgi:PAS domain S-box-containing protein